MIDKEALTSLITDLSNMIELNVFMNIKVFLDNVLPKAKTNEEKFDLLKYWINMTVDELEKKKNKELEKTHE